MEKVKKEKKPHSVHVAGELRAQWTVELPYESRHIGMACDDPAIEAVMEALPQTLQIFLWGETMAPAVVHLEIEEDDVEIEEDDRLEDGDQP